ncbi:MAG TPA: hypothetical protein VGC00_03420 [Thermoanaerobaculia bacterium]|jgi:hypothetical protein
MTNRSRGVARRELVLALAALSVAPGLLVSCRRRPDPRALAAALAARLRRDEAVRALGRAVVATHPEESDAGALAARLAAELGWTPDAPGAELDRRLGERVRDDFRLGRLLVVDSWRLAATEARVAALLALAAG